MFVCMCYAVTERDWTKALAQHQGNVSEAMAETKAGTCCGCCEGDLQRVAEARPGLQFLSVVA